jgi:chromatin structure-remodeling complex protein RSC7
MLPPQRGLILTGLLSTFNTTLTAARRANVNGVYDIHTNTVMYPATLQPTHARMEQVVDNEDMEAPASSEVFPPLKPIVARNFLVTDIYLETPPIGVSPAAYDMPFRTSKVDRESSARADFLSSFRGLSAVPADVRDLLPDECRAAFDTAVKHEKDWFAKWDDESKVASRRPPVIDKAIVPYTMPLM